MHTFKEQVAVITGAGGGVGQALALDKRLENKF
jgi:NADP-dependent 3-hydroxy acid dehydrogenase YdfG